MSVSQIVPLSQIEDLYCSKVTKAKERWGKQVVWKLTWYKFFIHIVNKIDTLTSTNIQPSKRNGINYSHSLHLFQNKIFWNSNIFSFTRKKICYSNNFHHYNKLRIHLLVILIMTNFIMKNKFSREPPSLRIMTWSHKCLYISKIVMINWKIRFFQQILEMLKCMWHTCTQWFFKNFQTIFLFKKYLIKFISKKTL